MQRQLISSGTPWERLAGYSRAVRVGPHIFVAGTTAADAQGTVQHPGDATGQTRFVLQKIATALTEAGASLQDVVRTRVFVQRVEDWEAVARVHGEVFGAIRPANTLVRADLIDPAMLVEIEVEALVSS